MGAKTSAATTKTKTKVAERRTSAKQRVTAKTSVRGGKAAPQKTSVRGAAPKGRAAAGAIAAAKSKAGKKTGRAR